MKKYLIALLSLVFAVSSCEFKDVFYLTNTSDMVTVSEGQIVNDYGYAYAITQDNTDKGWNEEGARHYIVFDVLNRQYDIALKQYLKATISHPVNGVPLPEEGGALGADPVEVINNRISGGYLNLVLKYYRMPSSEHVHRMSLRYIDHADSNMLELRLIHDGNGENPAQRSSSDLVQDACVYCFPLEGMAPKGSSRTLMLTIDYLNTTSDGKSEIKQASFSLVNNAPISF